MGQTHKKSRKSTKDSGRSNAAANSKGTQLVCDPIELRDILNAAPTGKAGGPDGLPSQALKALPFTQIKQLAAAFTQLANDITYCSEHRPQIWDLVGAVLIPKKQKADQLEQYRPISLKLYGRWLLIQAKPILDGQISENQSGFRAHRQAAEPLSTLLRITELAREWKDPVTLLKLDLKKAFDSVRQSKLIETLQDSELPEKLTYNLTREIAGAKMRPTLFGCKPAGDIPVKDKAGGPRKRFVICSHY